MIHEHADVSGTITVVFDAEDWVWLCNLLAMTADNPTPKQPGDELYVVQMCSDLEKAEKLLLDTINYRGMSFSQARLDDAQANVDRLHDLIRSYRVIDLVASSRKPSEAHTKSAQLTPNKEDE